MSPRCSNQVWLARFQLSRIGNSLSEFARHVAQRKHHAKDQLSIIVDRGRWCSRLNSPKLSKGASSLGLGVSLRDGRYTAILSLALPVLGIDTVAYEVSKESTSTKRNMQIRYVQCRSKIQKENTVMVGREVGGETKSPSCEDQVSM